MTNNPTIDGVSREQFESANPVPFGVFWSEPDSRYMTTMWHLKCLEYNGQWRGWQGAQSTIAQLQARVQELESGRGEADAWALLNGNGQIRDLTDRWDVAKHWDGIVEPMYFALPAPVAVVLPERQPVATTCVTRDRREGWNACLDATAALNTIHVGEPDPAQRLALARGEPK